MILENSPSRAEIATAVAEVRKTRSQLSWDTISARQSRSTKDRGVRGPLWVSRVTFPAAGDEHLLRLITDCISGLGDGGRGHGNYTLPPVVQVSAEWVGWRSGVTVREVEPAVSEEQKYKLLMKDVSSSVTVFYLPGGNFYMGSPAAYRRAVAKLAELTHGKILTVGYRLAPQNPFPAALLDVLTAYLSLLYPPDGSYHEPVDPSNIVFAGDSAGASLCLSLIQVILATRRRQGTELPIVRFHGRHVELKMPSGLSFLSLSPDQTLSPPSWSANVSSDIFPDTFLALDPKYPTCELWPAKPPRGNLYCEVSMLDHPLVSPLTARDWVGCPPMWIATGGGERLIDSARFVAQNAARQGVTVIWEEYEAMPHIWPLLFPTWPQTLRCWENWARACRSFAKGAPTATSGNRYQVGSLQSQQIDIFTLTNLSMDDVLGYMRNHQKNVRPFTGEKNKAML